MPTTIFEEEKIWTYDEYLNLPVDLNIYEIIQGELYMTPAPSTKHQRISKNLFRALDQYIIRQHSGEIFYSPIDVVLDSLNVVQPDIIFISKENLHIIAEKNIQGSPDLVIEILSPGTIQKDRIFKMRIYAKFGVMHLWILDPDNQTIEAFELNEKKTYSLITALSGKESFQPSLFPNLTIYLEKVWG